MRERAGRSGRSKKGQMNAMLSWQKEELIETLARGRRMMAWLK
jgi:hypothetical protein